MSKPRRKKTGRAGGRAETGRAARRFALDAVAVVWLRSLRLAGGGDAARRELALMVTEKCYGHAAFARALASGRLGRSPEDLSAAALAFYGSWVRYNRRRLSRRG